MTVEEKIEAWTAQACAMGADAARTAASWTVDGNTKTEFIPAVLRMLDEGDPAADDYLPARPDLSGQWADDMTPARLFEAVTGLDAHAEATFNQDVYQDVLETLCSAWEAGVDDTFQAACEAELRKALPTLCPDCGQPISLQPSGWWTHDGLPGDCWRWSMDGPNAA